MAFATVNLSPSLRFVSNNKGFFDSQLSNSFLSSHLFLGTSFSVPTLSFSTIHQTSCRPHINASPCSSTSFRCFAQKSSTDGLGSNGAPGRITTTLFLSITHLSIFLAFSSIFRFYLLKAKLWIISVNSFYFWPSIIKL